MSIPAPKIKYLTNKDLLEEIHKSKLTYCSFVDPQYTRYDFITQNTKMITKKRIEEARKKKLADMQAIEKKEQVARGIKNPKSNLSLADVPAENIVIRVMTFDHIPINEEKIGKAKTEAERHIRCNFPPFQHFIMKDGELICVLKSHWKDGLENGYFHKEHGKITNNLAIMFMKLVDRYGHRGNWRGYCCDDTTEALTNRGFLKYNQITTNDVILSYCNGSMVWSKIKSIYQDTYQGLMHHLTSPGIDALVTPNHRFLTSRGLVPVELLDHNDTLILMGHGIVSTENIPFNDLVDKDTTIIKTICSGEMIDGLPSTVSIGGIDFHGGWRGYGPTNYPTVEYNGTIWCPETEYGCFVARRNGKVYLTGNTYIDEMKSQALLQLSQVGLQFDESRSETPNPFAYYTQTISNSFMRILNIEKKNQNIRDDILIMHGASPSYTRMVDNEIAQKNQSKD